MGNSLRKLPLDILDMLDGHDTTYDILEQILKDPGNPQYFNDLFLREERSTPSGEDEEGILHYSYYDVYGEILPNLPDLATIPVEADLLKRPLQRYERAKAQLEQALDDLKSVREDVEKRLITTAESSLHKIKGGRDAQRQLLQRMALNDLDIFSSGEQSAILHEQGNKNVFLISVAMPDLVLEPPHVISDDSDPWIETSMRQYVYDSLDHSTAIMMAIGHSSGHDKIERNVTVDGSLLTNKGELLEYHLSDTDGDQNFWQDGRSPTTEELDELDPNRMNLVFRLDYTFEVPKNRTNDTIEMLRLMGGQPIFRGVAMTDESSDNRTGNLDDLVFDANDEQPEESGNSPEESNEQEQVEAAEESEEYGDEEGVGSFYVRIHEDGSASLVGEDEGEGGQVHEDAEGGTERSEPQPEELSVEPEPEPEREVTPKKKPTNRPTDVKSYSQALGFDWDDS